MLLPVRSNHNTLAHDIIDQGAEQQHSNLRNVTLFMDGNNGDTRGMKSILIDKELTFVPNETWKTYAI